MTHQNLQEMIDAAGSAQQLLRRAPGQGYAFPMRPQFTSWRDEQAAWKRTAVLFDQSFHMTDVYFTGPDVKRLFSDVGANSFATFGANKAKRFVACTPNGHFIGDAILFGLREDQYSLVGIPLVPDWVEYQAEIGDYDVEVVRDERTADNSGERLIFRFQIQGPRALSILERAHGGKLPPIKFFNVGEFEIAGCTVRALNHTMTGVPGLEDTGLEMWGPVANKARVHEALVAAGEPFGLREGGGIAYSTTPIESGWMARPVPALYAGDEMKAYREYLTPQSYEARGSLRGSFASPDIEDYFVTPWELGYDRSIRFDHDFIGREALERLQPETTRKQVWLRWNADDVVDVYRKGMLPSEQRAQLMPVPIATYATYQFDTVLAGDRPVGISGTPYYTDNLGCWATLALVEAGPAQDGQEVTVVWGEQAGDGTEPEFDRHVQVPVRATVSTQAPA